MSVCPYERLYLGHYKRWYVDIENAVFRDMDAAQVCFQMLPRPFQTVTLTHSQLRKILILFSNLHRYPRKIMKSRVRISPS